jgi:hypothetical protein
VSVYVDHLLPCLPNKNWRWNHSAHLFADTVAELHTFAARLGLKRIWFQDEGFFPHYDLTTNRHGKAVTLGAVLLTREKAMLKWHEILRRNEDGILQRDSLNP